MSEEIIYFEFNNWFSGRDYPNAEPFKTWIGDDLKMYFCCDRWCKENKLCVSVGDVDMSEDFCIAAPKSWVEENCPKLLTDEECGSYHTVSYYDPILEKRVEETQYRSNQYSNFLRPDQSSRFGIPFPEYCEENFGVTWYSNEYDKETGEFYYKKVDDVDSSWSKILESRIYGQADNENETDA